MSSNDGRSLWPGVTQYLIALCILAAAGRGTGQPVICLDPGHPSENGVGAKGRRYTEVKAAWSIATRLAGLLTKQGYRVVMTKVSENQFVSNRNRAKIANDAHANLLLRLHCDSGGGSGFATFYPDRQATIHGFKGPPPDVLTKSAALAAVFHTAAMQALTGSLPDLGVHTDRMTAIGRRQGALTGSVNSKVPVLLVEMCVLGNAKDEAFIRSRRGKEIMSQALLRGVSAAISVRQ